MTPGRRSLEQYLLDMRETAQGVVELVATLDTDTFLNTVTGSWALERGIIQLGEIAVQMRQQWPEYVAAHPELAPDGMRNARNIVVHGYAIIDRERILRMAAKDTPALLAHVETHLRALARARER